MPTSTVAPLFCCAPERSFVRTPRFEMTPRDPNIRTLPHRQVAGAGTRGFRRGLRFLPVLLLLLPTAGCYTFQQASVSEVVPGQDVRLRVTGAFADSLGPLIMRTDARVVEGSVISEASDALLVEIPVDNELVGMRLETLSQRVEIPEEAFVDVEVKELSKPRTAGAVAVVAGVAAAIVITQFNDDSGGAQRPGPGQPVESRVSRPFFSVSLGFFKALLGG